MTSDLGNAGSGGALTATATVAINVNAVNDAPVNTVPGAQAVNEDTPLVFSSTNGNLISVSDVDAGSGNLQVTLSVGQGALSLSGMAGLVFTVGDGAADGTMTFTGSVSSINAALAGLSYTPTGNYNGADTLTMLTSDLGNTGSGGALTGTATVPISVNAVNDAPVNSRPPAQATNEDTALIFSSGNGNLITIADIDAGSGNLQVTVSVAHGSLNLSGVAGLFFTSGDGVADATMTFTGTLSNINAALAGLSYAPDANYHGADTLTLVTSDLGNTGLGGALSDTNAVAITVNAVNDSPTGVVQVSGVATQGQTLSASHTLADPDGLGAITYHWIRNGVDTGSTGSNYLLTEADVGMAISARATYTDGDGSTEAVTSATSAVVTNVNDLPAGSVTISGTATQGQILSAGNTLSDPDGLGTITYHWSRDGTDTGSTGSTYLLTEADVGAVMSVRAAYTDGHGTAEAVDSANTAAVGNVNDLPTGSVTISGTATQGQTLSASNNLADLDGLGAITYHWLRNGTDTGATGTNYVLSEADVGAAITARATYTDGHGTSEAVNSAATSAVGNVNDPVLGGVTIIGTPTQGQTLSASSNITDADGLGAITYHWLRGGTDTGATGTNYVLSEADVGSTMTVVATYTDGHGTNESLTSAATGPVANANVVPTLPSGEPQVIAGPPGTALPTKPPSVLPDFASDTQPSPSKPPTEPTKPTFKPGVQTPASDGLLDGASTVPGNGAAVGVGSDKSLAGRGGPGSLGARALSGANQAGGFVFRLDAAGLELGINPGNVLFNLLSGLNGSKPASDQSLNLTLSSAGVHGRGLAATGLQFADNTEDRQVKVEKMVVQTSGAALSIGAVWWAARMSGLLASLMISTPAWRSIDPLPVMGLGEGPAGEDDEDGDGDGLEDPSGMDARADRLFGGHQTTDRQLEGIG